MQRLSRITYLVAILAILVGIFGVVSAQDDMMDNVLITEIGESDIPTLDPALATDSSSIQILNETYIGLTMLDDETAETAPGLATDWERVDNGDGTFTWTFNLIEEVSWVKYNAETGAVEQVLDEDGNVRFVTAYDLVYGWERSLNPATGDYYGSVLASEVMGGVEYNSQEIAEDGTTSLDFAATVGVVAVDDYTVQITTDADRLSTQPSIYGMWMSRPQPSWVIEEFGELWIDDANFVGYGPFALWEWENDEFISIIRNPFWAGTANNPQPQLDGVVFRMLDSVTALAEYEAGNLDDVDAVDSASIPRIQADPVLSQELVIETSSCSYYYGLGVDEEGPSSNVHFRRALSFAVDRVQIVEEVTQGGETPATYFTLPDLAGAPSPDLMEENGFGISFDANAALEELDIALEELGFASVDELPPITLLYNTSEGHRRIAEAIRDMWSDTLGIDVQLTNQDFGVYLDQRVDFPIYRAGWCMDYPDANNFLFDVFHSSRNPDTGYSSAEFDALVEQAVSETDPAVRADLYAQAEQLLVFEDAAIIPIYWYSDLELTKPYVERTYAVDNSEQYEHWSLNR